MDQCVIDVTKSENNEYTIRDVEPKHITFFAEGDEWIMKLTPQGIQFNLERYPPTALTEMICDMLIKHFGDRLGIKQKSL